MSVRETVWLAARPAILARPEEALDRLIPWANDADFRIRRFASEATRPRGVWCAHFPEMKSHPERGLPLLEPLRADSAKYVQLSVGNWLNDASKSRPDWVESLAARWAEESPQKSTQTILKRGMRTLRKS